MPFFSFFLFSQQQMRLATLAVLFTTAVSASYLPGFIVQDNDLADTTMFGDSTKLITNCGDADDLLTQVYKQTLMHPTLSVYL